MPERKRIVIDTNIYVDARMRKKKGAAKRLVDDGIGGRVEVIYSDRVKQEADRILAKFPENSQFKFDIYRLFYMATFIDNPVKVKICEDPADDMFIGCAITGRADYIVSHDAHLLTLDGLVLPEHDYTIHAVTPGDMYSRNLFE